MDRPEGAEAAMEGAAPVAPDGHDFGIRIIQTVKLSDAEMLKIPAHIRVLVAEILREVPDPDFIEIRAIRYDVKEAGE